MKKYIIGGITVLAIVAVAILNLNYNNSPSKNLSAVSLANIEALADEYDGGTLPEVVISCNTGGSGRCYYVHAEEGLFGVCHFDCSFNGSMQSYCSSCWINIYYNR
ncbi:hypothetical protein EZS27_022048 [termite gut metagenome]|uniref:NVEALA family protein n=1 Tax=termite gut metagenome TaxID=433724 RepID=A0A5J4R5Z4_9ZZZZ